jgi:hypothetical protein
LGDTASTCWPDTGPRPSPGKSRLTVAPDHFIAPKFRRAAKKNPFTVLKPFASGARIFGRTRVESDRTMKNMVPVFLALIPLLAMVGACVAVP